MKTQVSRTFPHRLVFRYLHSSITLLAVAFASFVAGATLVLVEFLMFLPQVQP